MQRVKPRMSRARAIVILLCILLLLAGLAWGGVRLFGTGAVTGVSAARLPCPYDDNLRVFGNSVLYYDNMSIHCMSGTGAVRWSFEIGAGAAFDCDDQHIVAWVGSTVYVLDQNGNSSYNDNLNEEVQFARIGKQYIGVVIGETATPRLLVKDLTGSHMDEEADAYTNLIILDLGFYGANGEYMWTLALDVFGTAANTVLNTFEVGRMNTGEVSLGEAITYQVLYDNSLLRVINTRRMLTFDYRGTEDASARVLVYGWQLLDYETPERGNALLLFAPTSQYDELYKIRELRLISGSTTDKRYSLPATCVGATVWNRALYAFSPTVIYRAGMNDSRFTTYDLPLDAEATRLVGVLDDGQAVIACENDVFVVTLPRGSALTNERGTAN